MFTGIIQAVGEVGRALPAAQGVRLSIRCPDLELADVRVGDSIAVDGVCLTAVALAPGEFSVDVSRETLDCTAGFAEGARVNLEKALRFSDRLGGHLVSGHVDGVGEVIRFDPAGESMLLAVRAPDVLARYLARKGSIAVNGVSLTVNDVEGGEFRINLIPHTLAVTNLGALAPGAKVNLEADIIARYCARLLGMPDAPD